MYIIACHRHNMASYNNIESMFKRYTHIKKHIYSILMKICKYIYKYIWWIYIYMFVLIVSWTVGKPPTPMRAENIHISGICKRYSVNLFIEGGNVRRENVRHKTRREMLGGQCPGGECPFPVFIYLLLYRNILEHILETCAFSFLSFPFNQTEPQQRVAGQLVINK